MSVDPDCSAFSVKRLKEELAVRGVDYTGLSINEKGELISLLEANWDTPIKEAPTLKETKPKPSIAESGWRAAGKCPFSSASGYTTEEGRREWISAKGMKLKSTPDTLKANIDVQQPLYYWQIHSILGSARIEDLIRRFYTRIIADETPGSIAWAFTRIGPLEHHIATQTAFWVDAMGGGRQYHGGDYRLSFHHEHNARDVMNAAGAKRWMHHMGVTLIETNWSGIDPRIKPCVIDFLRHKVQKYASAQHVTKYAQWRFDESDFSFVAQDPEMIALYRAGPSAPGAVSLSEEDQLCLTINLATTEELQNFSVKELKVYLAVKGTGQAEVTACVERVDLLALANQGAIPPV